MKNLLLLSACLGLVEGSGARDEQRDSEYKSWWTSARNKAGSLAGASAIAGAAALAKTKNVISGKAAAAVGVGALGVGAYKLYQHHRNRKLSKEEEVIDTLSVGMDRNDKERVLKAVAKVAPENYDQFVQTCNQLSVGVDGDDKIRVISSVAMVAPKNYTQFIQTCNQISVGMDGHEKTRVLEEVAKVAPENYDQFVQTCNQLSVGMAGYYKIEVISSVARVVPESYASFIQTVNALSKEMGSGAKTYLIVGVSYIQPDWYAAFCQYAMRYNFFTFVVPTAFSESMWHAWFIGELTTPEQFWEIVIRLEREFAAQGATRAQPSVAFDIHDYMRQEVQTPSGQTNTLKDAIVDRISELTKKQAIQDFETSAALVMSVLSDQVFAEENAKRGAQKLPPIAQELVTWALNQVRQDQTYSKIFNQTVAYVQSLGALQVWAKHFVLNSATAYDTTSKGLSCPMGVRERILTSLMFVSNLDPAIADLFEQSETADTLNKLVASWGTVINAASLKEAGARSRMTAEVALPIFDRLAHDTVRGVTGLNLEDLAGSQSMAMITLLDTANFSKSVFKNRWDTVFQPELRALESGSSSSEDEAPVVNAVVPNPQIAVGHLIRQLSFGMTPDQKMEISEIVNGFPQEVDRNRFLLSVNQRTQRMNPEQRLVVIRQLAAEVSGPAPREQ